MSQPKYKISRILGCNLWGRPKDPFNFKNYFPGQHGQSVSRMPTKYGTELKAKRKLRAYYNMREKQFIKTFKEAKTKRGDTGENFVNFLERRLDMMLYRCNFVPTVFSARQCVSHGYVLVNGRKVDIRSYRLSDGDTVSLTEKYYNIGCVANAINAQERNIPEYLKLSDDKKTATFVRSPTFAEIPYESQMELHLVIEHYSS